MSQRRHGDARSTGSSHLQQPIDLLTVQDDAKDTSGGPNIARGLSIKLVPPEDSNSSDEDLAGFRTETPTFYHSTSVSNFNPSDKDAFSKCRPPAMTLVATVLFLIQTFPYLPSLTDSLT